MKFANLVVTVTVCYALKCFSLSKASPNNQERPPPTVVETILEGPPGYAGVFDWLFDGSVSVLCGQNPLVLVGGALKVSANVAKRHVIPYIKSIGRVPVGSFETRDIDIDAWTSSKLPT